ncbi:MAG: hypothetical protein PHV08_03400 [Sulfurovaceae bacterium]|nr:hypothetical protein [Sulfurovaceae bacterium]
MRMTPYTIPAKMRTIKKSELLRSFRFGTEGDILKRPQKGIHKFAFLKTHYFH